ncbi:glycosyltransferase [Trinickia terrae]|uniref:Glycosyltransferase n=1 Tax=Trinickia terrae TaxID=2571161 RepID=A0A4U1HPA3_9BURK|nr:glycosyltransferase [Trinickia terrae]TKC83172.1 glycosyltransferase [Trinickia terrae]
MTHQSETHRKSSVHSRESGLPLRILFHINDFGKGGTETALLAWLNALDRRLFAPSLSVTYPTEDLAFWRSHLLPKDVPVHVLAPSRWMHALHQAERRGRLGGVKKLMHKVSTHGAIRPLVARRFLRIAPQHDLICDFDFSLRRIAGLGNVPWIGVSHYSVSARLGGKRAAHVSRRVRQLERYAAIAVLTPDMRREARQVFAASRVNVEELPNVVDVDAIRRRAGEEIERHEKPFIVSVARLDEGQKDHKTLLRAYARVCARRPATADLVLIGDGPDRQSLETLAGELGIRESVHFLGFCANPFPHIRQAEMLILSSRYEGFGMVLGEAMALGTPVISADCPTGPRDLLEGGRAGLLVVPGDADAMADAIERLLTDSELRRQLTSNALAKVETFAPPSANQRMMELARRLCGIAGADAAGR